MFAGSEGPERAVAGRYEGRQTRQVPSALFWAFLRWRSACGSESCTEAPGADRGAACRDRRGRHRIGGERRCGWAAPRPFLDTSYSGRTDAPDCCDLAGTATRDSDVVQQGIAPVAPRGAVLLKASSQPQSVRPVGARPKPQSAQPRSKSKSRRSAGSRAGAAGLGAGAVARAGLLRQVPGPGTADPPDRRGIQPRDAQRDRIRSGRRLTP